MSVTCSTEEFTGLMKWRDPFGLVAMRWSSLSDTSAGELRLICWARLQSKWVQNMLIWEEPVRHSRSYGCLCRDVPLCSRKSIFTRLYSPIFTHIHRFIPVTSMDQSTGERVRGAPQIEIVFSNRFTFTWEGTTPGKSPKIYESSHRGRPLLSQKLAWEAGKKARLLVRNWLGLFFGP